MMGYATMYLDVWCYTCDAATTPNPLCISSVLQSGKGWSPHIPLDKAVSPHQPHPLQTSTTNVWPTGAVCQPKLVSNRGTVPCLSANWSYWLLLVIELCTPLPCGDDHMLLMMTKLCGEGGCTMAFMNKILPCSTGIMPGVSFGQAFPWFYVLGYCC